MNTILLILCNALSCFIISTILFQFMNGKYKKSSQSRYVYIVIETDTVMFTSGALGRVDGGDRICSVL